MSKREHTYIRILFVALLLMALVGALCIVFRVQAAPLATPYLSSCFNGVCTVYWPGVSGYDSGYLEIVSGCTGQSNALYLVWQEDHPLDMGEYETDISQMFSLGSCPFYYVTDGFLGYQEIYLPSGTDVFSFQMWQSWLAGLP